MKEKWKKIYSNDSKLMYVGFTVDGRPCGVGTSYFENGNKCQEGLFDYRGLVCGREYYMNGNLRFEGTYECSKPDPKEEFNVNYPSYGTCYDEDGNEYYHGKLTLWKWSDRTPDISSPEWFGSVIQNGMPMFDYRKWYERDRELKGVFYVCPKGKKKREEFVAILEKNGFECVDDTITTRESTIESRYPITIDFDRRVYGHIHNTTCAAGAASSVRMYQIDIFLAMVEQLYSFIIV